MSRNVPISITSSFGLRPVLETIPAAPPIGQALMCSGPAAGSRRGAFYALDFRCGPPGPGQAIRPATAHVRHDGRPEACDVRTSRTPCARIDHAYRSSLHETQRVLL